MLTYRFLYKVTKKTSCFYKMCTWNIFVAFTLKKRFDYCQWQNYVSIKYTLVEPQIAHILNYALLTKRLLNFF